MKKNRRCALAAITFIAVAALGGGIQGCVSSSYSMPNSEQLISFGIVDTSVDTASLDRGRALAMTTCHECHRQRWPQQKSPEEWPPYVRKMGRRGGLNSGQIRDLAFYMVEASKTAELEETL